MLVESDINNENQVVDTSNQDMPSGCLSVLFGFIILFLLIFAEVFDQVRHGDENLMLGFGIPFWVFTALLSSGSVHLLWHFCPGLIPERGSQVLTSQAMFVSCVLVLLGAMIWSKSPLFSFFYDSVKIIVTIVVGGPLLGLIYRLGQWRSVWCSGLATLLAVVVSLGFYCLLVGLSRNEDSHSFWSSTWGIARVGVPYTFLLSLFSCWRKTALTR